MQKQILILTLLIGSSALRAQVKPVTGDWGMGFRITGLQNVGFEAFDTDMLELPQVLVRYYLSQRVVARATIGIDLNHASEDFSTVIIDSVRFAEATRIDSTNNNSVKQSGFSINPGAEYHFSSQASKIDPFVGLTIPITIIGATKTTEELDYQGSLLSGGRPLFREDISTNKREDGGFRIGLDFLAGFSYFFSDNFALGAEYALGFGYLRVGGTVESTRTGVRQVTPDPSALETVDESERFTQLFTETALALSATGGVNISIFW